MMKYVSDVHIISIAFRTLAFLLFNNHSIDRIHAYAYCVIGSNCNFFKRVLPIWIEFNMDNGCKECFCHFVSRYSLYLSFIDNDVPLHWSSTTLNSLEYNIFLFRWYISLSSVCSCGCFLDKVSVSLHCNVFNFLFFFFI